LPMNTDDWLRYTGSAERKQSAGNICAWPEKYKAKLSSYDTGMRASL